MICSMRPASWLLTLCLMAGCGKPLTSAGATVITPPSGVGAGTAWLVCGTRPPDGAIPIARYHRCRIVALVEPGPEPIGEPLGPVEHLRKVDPAVLVKAMARYKQLHVRAHLGQGPSSQGYDPSPPLQVGCSSRGFEWDLDCPHAAIPALLAHPSIGAVTPYNRPYVRWR
jgi:hypothetical protein